MAEVTYDPYGNVVSSTNPGSITNNLQFQRNWRHRTHGAGPLWDDEE
jgi:hypothetical protein